MITTNKDTTFNELLSDVKKSLLSDVKKRLLSLRISLWQKLRIKELLARSRRIDCEKELLNQLHAQEEETIIVVTDDEEFEIQLDTIYIVDDEAVEWRRRTQPRDVTDYIDKVFKRSYTVDSDALRSLQAQDPDIYQIIAQAIKTKPSIQTIHTINKY